MNTGGPAFPRPGDFNPQMGMTLRDYFAAKAMQALIQTSYFDTTARMSYDMADAMLRAREAK